MEKNLIWVCFYSRMAEIVLNISSHYHFTSSLNHWGGQGGGSSARQETTFDATVLLCGWKVLDFWGLIDGAQYQKIGCDKEEGKEGMEICHIREIQEYYNTKRKGGIKKCKPVVWKDLQVQYVGCVYWTKSLMQRSPEKSSSPFLTHGNVFTSQPWLWMIKWL